MFNFDGTNPATSKVMSSLRTENMNISKRPMQEGSRYTQDPTFKWSHKDNNLVHVPQSTPFERSYQNFYKEIPHKDYLPIYANPYRTPNETGWKNINLDDLFRE